MRMPARPSTKLLLAAAAAIGVSTALTAGALAARAPTPREEASITAVILRAVPPVWRGKVEVANILSTRSPVWARADARGKPGFRNEVQQERFALNWLPQKRRWRPYLVHAECPIRGMPAAVKRELGIVCY